MKDCKPCITIRTVLKLLYKNFVVEAYQRFRSDYRSYSMVNATACELDNSGKELDINHLTETTKHTVKTVHDIRSMAKENYIPTETHSKQMLASAAKTWLESADKAKADPAVVAWAQRLVESAGDCA